MSLFIYNNNSFNFDFKIIFSFLYSIKLLLFFSITFLIPSKHFVFSPEFLLFKISLELKTAIPSSNLVNIFEKKEYNSISLIALLNNSVFNKHVLKLLSIKNSLFIKLTPISGI